MQSDTALLRMLRHETTDAVCQLICGGRCPDDIRHVELSTPDCVHVGVLTYQVMVNGAFLVQFGDDVMTNHLCTFDHKQALCVTVSKQTVLCL